MEFSLDFREWQVKVACAQSEVWRPLVGFGGCLQSGIRKVCAKFLSTSGDKIREGSKQM